MGHTIAHYLQFERYISADSISNLHLYLQVLAYSRMPAHMLTYCAIQGDVVMGVPSNLHDVSVNAHYPTHEASVRLWYRPNPDDI